MNKPVFSASVMAHTSWMLAALLCGGPVLAADLKGRIAPLVEREYASLEKLYTHCHSHPELSFREEKTAQRLAHELKTLGIYPKIHLENKY